MTTPGWSSLLFLTAAVSITSGVALARYDGRERCEGYGRWQDSDYVLPYPPGESYRLQQGNCAPSGNGHRGVARYSYDFDMQVGTPFTAARAGRVLHVVESHFDGEVAAAGYDNYAVVQHIDGTVALYGHLTHDGALVEVGQTVSAGDAIGYSGNTGNTNNLPHLHFSVHSCDPVSKGSSACPTLPISFRNTEPNPRGLIRGHRYRAGPVPDVRRRV